MSVTASDFFCGCGGSSWGMKRAGLDIKFAANHDHVCINTHAANLPETDHACVDIQQSDPKRFPKTDIAWLSPECQSHSAAKTKKTANYGYYETDLWGERQIDPDEERSRMTMYEAYRYAETHRPVIVIIENVPQIRKWAKFPIFIREIKALGYDYRELILNSRFFGVPQSRERYYGVFWQHGHPAPDLDFRPTAVCLTHGQVAAVQTWKAGATGHQYGQSYDYRCPHCKQRVEPGIVPSGAIIDWSLPAPRVADRKRDLAPKTRARILAGLKKFGEKAFVLDTAHAADKHPRHVYAMDRPLPTLTQLESMYLGIPAFIVENRQSRREQVFGMNRPLPTLTTTSPHYLTIPPFLMSINHSTIRNRGTDEPLPTVMPQANPTLVLPDAFIVEYRNVPDQATQTLDEPLSTITQVNHHALLMAYYGSAPIYIEPDTDPLTTITTKPRHALILTDDEWNGVIDECRYRLLSVNELKLGQSLPNEYVLLGSKTKQISMIGNAVSCNVAQALAERCIATFN